MRLLDRIAQVSEPLLVRRGTEVLRLPAAIDFATAVSICPLRLVLTDPLTSACASLAYADGDRLARCLDLVHVPARQLWVEWLDEPRLKVVNAALGFPSIGVSEDRARAGAYVTADPSGRRGTLRTFWGPAGGAGEPSLSPVITDFDFDAAFDEPGPAASVLSGAPARLSTDDDALASILDCVRFRFDATWAAYYRAECRSATEQEAVTRSSLASVATDLPVLLALFLLMSSRARLPQRCPDLGRLNRQRVLAGRAPLLDHIEVMAPVMSDAKPYVPANGSLRRIPRLHHVRGHLVRRGSSVYWRIPHVRGSAAGGQLRTRSVTLHFDPLRHGPDNTHPVSTAAPLGRARFPSSYAGGPS